MATARTTGVLRRVQEQYPASDFLPPSVDDDDPSHGPGGLFVPDKLGNHPGNVYSEAPFWEVGGEKVDNVEHQATRLRSHYAYDGTGYENLPPSMLSQKTTQAGMSQWNAAVGILLIVGAVFIYKTYAK